MPLFFGLFILFLYSHSITFIQYIRPSSSAEVLLHLLIACGLSGKKIFLWCEAEIRTRPALQQAYALPTELTPAPFMSYTAPY
jgi:hypothetical protein